MKQSIFLSLLFVILLFSACGPDTTQLKADVDALQKQWTDATTNVENWTEALTNIQADLNASLDTTLLSPEAKAKLAPAQLTTLDSLEALIISEAGALDGIQQKTAAYSADWGKYSQELADVKEQLTSGKVDVAKATQEVMKLKKQAEETNTTLSGWQESLELVQKNAGAAQAAYSSYKSSLSAAGKKK